MNEFMTVPVEWKADGDNTGTLQGYASVFGVIDNQGDVIEKGAFTKTIRERVPKGQVPLIDTHGLANGFPPIPTARDVLGTIVAAKEDARGLLIKAQFSSAEYAQETRAKVAEGHIGFLSIGYQPIRFRFEEREVDGRKALVRVLEEVKLGEVSIAPLPANELATITAVKAATGALDRDWTYEGAASFVAAIDRLRAAFESKAAGWDAELHPKADIPQEEPPAERPHRWLLNRAAETPWAMRPSALASVVELLSIRAQGEKVAQADDLEDVGDEAPVVAPDRAGKVAVLPIYGAIVPKATLMTNLSGGTSIEAFRKNFRKALNDESVSAIVLDVDSPGGAAVGVPEMADEIRAARGRKPIISVANSQAASGAYWLASQADEFWVTPSGEVGSIGAWIAHEDMSKALEMEGVDITLISAGKYKVEGNPFEPLSDEARAERQRKVDEIYAVFLEAVAAGRGTTVEKVRSDYGQGRMLSARRALKAGMVDGVGTLESLVARLGGDISQLKARPSYEYPTPEEIRAKVLHPQESKSDEMSFDVKEWLRTSKALLEDRDPNLLADPALIAAGDTRIDLLEQEISRTESALSAKAADDETEGRAA